ncbi:MAG: aminopeptidase [Phycisphaerales bacterium]|nr:MAG: aminopeptidase [Phycisphaerales bacterium]
MQDPRIEKLADVLINFSTRIEKGEHLLIEIFDAPEEMALALVRACRKAGGYPHVAVRQNRVMRALIADADDENLKVWADCDLHRMEQMQAYIGLRGSDNVSEMSGIDDDQMKKYGKAYLTPVHFEQRVKNTKWCVLRWPTPSMAQLAEKSTEEFEDFYFNVCTLDYARMDKAAQALVERMNNTDKVQIKGPGDTDLTFSIKDIPTVPCCGQMNIPDGECYTAPVRDSANGVIHFNTPTIYNGVSFENIRLVFKDGKVVEATCGDDAALNSILDTDEGARYVGEFAIGFNPYVLEAMKDILFDEKVAGSLHFTPGRAYDEAPNGNESEIHWDLVLIQRPEYGGGEIIFDGEVVRKDGLFVTDDLKALNPDALMG